LERIASDLDIDITSVTLSSRTKDDIADSLNINTNVFYRHYFIARNYAPPLWDIMERIMPVR
tara:strand:+ start:1889 stop:2074 length:186 start_codon:yes stop_codon:yes gene_type:complete